MTNAINRLRPKSPSPASARAPRARTWLEERWDGRLRFDARGALPRFNNSPSPVTLRVNPLKTTTAALVGRLAREDVTVRPARFAPDALIVEQGNPLRGTLLEEGW